MRCAATSSTWRSASSSAPRSAPSSGAWSATRFAISAAIGLVLGGTDFSNLFILLEDGTVPGPYVSLEAAKDAGAVTVAYGVLLNTIINFLIVAFALFMVIKGMNRMKRKQVEAPAAPPGPTKEETLLTEIRDLLAQR